MSRSILGIVRGGVAKGLLNIWDDNGVTATARKGVCMGALFFVRDVMSAIYIKVEVVLGGGDAP